MAPFLCHNTTKYQIICMYIVYGDILTKGGSSVVECLTRDREAVGLSLTGVTALWSLSKTHLS